MKAILRTLVALLVVFAGAAWAVGGAVEETLPTPAPQVELPEQVEPEAEGEAEELTAEDLEDMDPDLVEADACCMAECFEQFTACKAACGGDDACVSNCIAQKRACRQNC